MHVNPDGGVTVEFAERIVKLAAAWGARLDEGRIRIYARALGDVPLRDLDRAFGEAIRECKFFPSVAEIRAYVTPMREDAGLVAWTALSRAASSAGAYVSVVVEDAAAAEALEAVFGSWGEFCLFEDGPGLALKRQEFMAAYRGARTRGVGEPRRLTGILSPPPADLAPHTWIARIAGASVTIERDRPALGGRTPYAALPEARTEE